MSIQARQNNVRPEPPRHPLFGQGAHEPYAKALRHGLGTLSLEPAYDDVEASPLRFKVQQWCESSTPAEVALLRASGGPVLDVGCGPGRMLVAAASLGLRALGVDVSGEAVAQAKSRGALAVRQSIFDAVPYEGQWETVLLLDGNIGIGGNIAAMLRRLGQVLAPSGSVLVEVEQEAALDVSYAAILRGSGHEASEPFPWARVGSMALDTYASDGGWTAAQWTTFPPTDCLGGSLEAEAGQERLICRLTRRGYRSTPATDSAATATKTLHRIPKARA